MRSMNSGTAAEERHARHEADDDPQLGADPASREGQAQEEDRAENEGQPADQGEGAAREPLLDIAERP